MKDVIEHADYVLSTTPDLLPVLKQAGVVDSGGQGLMEVLKGAFDAYLGKVTDFTLKSSGSSSKKTCVYSGKKGAYAEQAIEQYFDGDIKAESVDSFTEIFKAVVSGKADYGMVPIENSTAGSVYENYDNLTRFEDVSIVGGITFSVLMFTFEFWKSCFRISKKVIIRLLQIHLSICKSKAIYFF